MTASDRTTNSDNADSMPISIRPAISDDLDAIVEIFIKAFPFDDQFGYRYPHRERYPEDHYKYTKLYYAAYLDATLAGQSTIMIAEALDTKDPTKTKVISFSIWDHPNSKTSNKDIPAMVPPKRHPERRDCNPKRLEAFKNAKNKARAEVFADRFGQRQLSLRQLATLPDYWRHGAASKLLTWGMDRASEEEIALSVFAGPMGKNLYEKHGFEVLRNVHIHAEGEKEKVWLVAMAWDPTNAEVHLTSKENVET